MWFRPKKYEAFEQWCDDVKERKEESTLKLSEYAKTKQATPAQHLAGFAVEVRHQIQDEKLSLKLVSIDAGKERFNLELSKLSPDLQIHKGSKCHVLRFNTGEVESCELNSVIIGRLLVGRRTTLLSLDHCRVGSLLIVGSEKATDVQINDSWIGHLEVKSRTVHDLLIEGGTIRSVNCPPPDKDNPISGHVRFENVDFPTDLKPGFREGAQPYTNLRAHLEELQNTPMAGLMRTLELATERHKDRGLNKVWSYFWGWCANYGYSPGRALKRAGYLILLMAAVIWLGDGGAPGLPDEWYKPGTWRADLLDPSYANKMQVPRGRFEAIWTVGKSLVRGDPLPTADLEIVLNRAAMGRSAILSFQAVVNPLNIFGTRSLVIASTHWGNLFLIVFGLVTDLMIVVAVLGIRKRFKLH